MEHPLLGPWEPSITLAIPYDEVIFAVGLFLRDTIVRNNDPGMDWSGKGGPMLEIEAKLGHVMEKRTNTRAYLGTKNEAVLENTDAFFFKSSMTEVST